jgi:hypothetical protein
LWRSGRGPLVAEAEPELIEDSGRLPIIVDVEFKLARFAEEDIAGSGDAGGLPRRTPPPEI